MTTVHRLSEGTAHKLPADLKTALLANEKAVSQWESITPLARNEWICWTVTVKQQKTRDNHILRTVNELAEGKRRPCCWMGCIHRKDKQLNKTQKWIAGRQVNSS